MNRRSAQLLENPCKSAATGNRDSPHIKSNWDVTCETAFYTHFPPRSLSHVGSKWGKTRFTSSTWSEGC